LFLVIFIVYSGLGLLSHIEVSIFLCRLFSFVISLAKRLAGKTTVMISFYVEGVPLLGRD